MKKRIDELCQELDTAIFGKRCIYISNTDDNKIPSFKIPSFHDEDDEEYMDSLRFTFQEILLWYIQLFGFHEDRNRYEPILELINIYAYYTQKEKVKNIKKKCKKLLNKL